MLSNPPHMSGLHSRQRQHRRQNSTPSAFDAVKIAPLPNLQQRRPMSHRRGLSLDTRGQPLAPAPTTTTMRQDYLPVSISTTNTGQTTTQQHVLREAQQQRTARPGSGQPTFTPQDSTDTFLISPQVTPQSRRFTNTMPGQDQAANVHGLPFIDTYSASLGLFDRSVNRLGSTIDPSQDFEFFGPESALSTPSFMTFPESSPGGWNSETETTSTHSRRSSRRISNGIMDKVAKFEAMGHGPDGSTERPCTPSGQMANEYFPQTPAGTSIKQESTPQQIPNRFFEGYDESMEETLKPVRNQANNRNSGIFQDLRQQAESMAKTPPRSNSIPMAISSQGLRTPEFMNMRNISAEFKKIEREFGMIPSSPADMPPIFSLMTTENTFSNKPDFRPPGFTSHETIPQLSPPSPISKSPSRRASPHRRTESVASITSAASIADINIEETKTETGVTLEDIAAFIQGPDPSDGKWRCLYEGCNKPFGRKENIKSHVQTHLNDRQYQCPTCKKCFVRQHDLKRHAKIHTGIKPYPCECGNSFARHDALTRHRQRGMCIGAFDGVVRKVVKRGRPKKIRPDMDERRDKAERTRRKNKATSTNSASSQSGYSDISAANSPSNEFDGLLDDDQFPGIMSSSLASLTNPITTTTMNPSTLAAVSTAPIPTTVTGAMTEVLTALSPSAMSNYSQTSHTTAPPPAPPKHQPPQQPTTGGRAEYVDLDTLELHNPPSPTKSVASSHYTHAHLPNTPPDLSSPRSPPALLPSDGNNSHTNTRFFDLDLANTSLSDSEPGTGANARIGLNTASTTTTTGTGTGTSNGTGNADAFALEHQELLLGFHPLEQMQMQMQGCGPGGMMKFEKFGEDEFDPVSMFTHGEDVFFGTA